MVRRTKKVSRKNLRKRSKRNSKRIKRSRKLKGGTSSLSQDLAQTIDATNQGFRGQLEAQYPDLASVGSLEQIGPFVDPQQLQSFRGNQEYKSYLSSLKLTELISMVQMSGITDDIVERMINSGNPKREFIEFIMGNIPISYSDVPEFDAGISRNEANITESLIKEKEVCKRILRNKYCHEYINQSIRNLEIICDTISGETNTLKNLHKHVMDDRNPCAAYNAYGCVNNENFDDLYEHGSIREKMANFVDLIGQDIMKNIYIKLIISILDGNYQAYYNKISHLINLQFLDNMISDLKEYTGLSPGGLSELLKGCLEKHALDLSNGERISNSTGKGIYSCLANDLYILPISKSPYLIRYAGYPWKLGRESREKELFYYKIDENNILPPLSEREKDVYRKADIPIKIGTGSGMKVISNSYFAELAKHYGRFIVSGPSGGTDQYYHIFGLLNNFNPELYCLCAIAYLCSNHDHSIFEVLMPCKKYHSSEGYTIQYYTEMDPYDYVLDLIDSYTNSMI
tara:strand:- start:434 stop:1975 length:1542 start_codon:yes stop_codon:yes gene_type:complete